MSLRSWCANFEYPKLSVQTKTTIYHNVLSKDVNGIFLSFIKKERRKRQRSRGRKLSLMSSITTSRRSSWYQEEASRTWFLAVYFLLLFVSVGFIGVASSSPLLTETKKTNDIDVKSVNRPVISQSFSTSLRVTQTTCNNRTIFEGEWLQDDDAMRVLFIHAGGVNQVGYSHNLVDYPNSIRVNYNTGLNQTCQWVCNGGQCCSSYEFNQINSDGGIKEKENENAPSAGVVGLMEMFSELPSERKDNEEEKEEDQSEDYDALDCSCGISPYPVLLWKYFENSTYAGLSNFLLQRHETFKQPVTQQYNY